MARAAGVSTASVSRVLNDSESVTAATRERVLRAARLLRYTPHAAARSLITRRTNTIGVLLPDLYGEFFSELIRGIDRAARVRSLHLLVSSSHGDAEEVAAAISAMRGRVDGLLIMSPHVDATILDQVVPADMPTVLLGSSDESGARPAVFVDNFGGAQAMTLHLLALHQGPVAHIGGPPDNLESRERLRGYRAALAEAGRAADEVLAPGDFSEESGYRAGLQLARLAVRPRAVFAANDMMAIGCLFALTETGLNVPADVALAGFDDIPIARFVTPPLTTVRIDIAGVGGRACERLAQRIEDDNSTTPTVDTLGTELVVRASCGAAAAGIRL